MTNIISKRFESLGLDVTATQAHLDRYVELLAKWNRKTNLTSLDLDPISTDAIDRLLVEPVIAASFAPTGHLRVIDIGSGGGSPAIPFRVQLQQAEMRMIESRSRKCAFLREVVRDIGLKQTFVEEARFEELTSVARLSGSANLVTVRAVRFDRVFVDLVRHVLEKDGLIFRFCSTDEADIPEEMAVMNCHHLIPGSTSQLQVIRFN